MLIITLVHFIAILQQELAQYLEAEPSLELYLTQLELQHDIESDYYHACGRW